MIKFVWIIFIAFNLKFLLSFQPLVEILITCMVVIGVIHVFFVQLNSFNKKRTLMIGFFLFSITYLFFISIIHEIEYYRYLKFYLGLLTPFLLIPFFLNTSSRIEKSFTKIFFSFLSLQLLLSFMQIFEFDPEFLRSEENSSIDSIFRGTFPNNNYLGNILVLSSLIIFNEIITKRYFNQNPKLIITFFSISIIGVYLTGIRTSLITLVIGILIMSIVFLSMRNIMKTLLIFFVSIFILFNAINVKVFLNTSKRITDEIILLNDFQDIKNSNSTISISLRIFEVIKNEGSILIGSNHFFNDQLDIINDGSGWKTVSMENKNVTDALLLIIITEFGIFGLFFFILPFFMIFWISYVNKKLIWILFLTLMLQTITDMGIFLLPSIILISAYLKYSQVSQERNL